MKITINSEVLKREHLTMGEFLVMLIGYYDVKYKDALDRLIERGADIQVLLGEWQDTPTGKGVVAPVYQNRTGAYSL